MGISLMSTFLYNRFVSSGDSRGGDGRLVFEIVSSDSILEVEFRPLRDCPDASMNVDAMQDQE